MNKTTAMLAATALTLVSSSAALAMGTDTYVGMQLGLTSLQNENLTDQNNLNLYGAMIGTSINDKFSADLNFVNQGNYFHGMVDLYFHHALSSKITSRIGGGIGAIHFNEGTSGAYTDDTVNNDSTTKFAYQGAVELEYAVTETLGVFSGYHYVGWNDSNTDLHANEYLFGLHYYL